MDCHRFLFPLFNIFVSLFFAERCLFCFATNRESPIGIFETMWCRRMHLTFIPIPFALAAQTTAKKQEACWAKSRFSPFSICFAEITLPGCLWFSFGNGIHAIQFRMTSFVCCRICILLGFPHTWHMPADNWNDMPAAWSKISGHPESNQGPSDCCRTLQSDALPTEL